MLAANYPIAHSAYTDGTDASGYRNKGDYATPVTRMIFAPAPESSTLTEGEEFTTRVSTRKILLVPDVTVFKVRDKVTLPEGDFLVCESVRDYTAGPFGYKPGGEVIVEKTDG